MSKLCFSSFATVCGHAAMTASALGPHPAGECWAVWCSAGTRETPPVPATAHVLLRSKGADAAPTINEQILREGLARVAPVRGYQVHRECNTLLATVSHCHAASLEATNML